MNQALQVQMSTQTANPFQGLRSCLRLFQEGGKGSISTALLDAAWQEVKSSKEMREMFFSLLFSLGDITGREHNIFKGNKVDSGGNAQREVFHTIYNWLKDRHYDQWLAFLNAMLFNEYISFDLIFANRVKTSGKKKVVGGYNHLTGSEKYLNDLAEFTAKIIKGNNPTHKYFLAKYLTRPRTSKRKGHKVMLPETKTAMQAKQSFLLKVSALMGFEVVKKTTHYEFPGYINWRKEYLGELESVLFSSKKILEFDKQQFLGWLDKLPSGARFRVRTRLLTKDNQLKIVETEESSLGKTKWDKLAFWFLEWENFKENKQTEQRVLEEKVRQGTATENDTRKLEVVKKQAKVTTGAVNFQAMFSDIIKGTIDKVKVQPFLDKINLPYNTLVFADDSGSMSWDGGANGIAPFDMAAFIATICLMKNPDDTGRSLLALFSDETRLFNMMTSTTDTANKLLRGKKQSIRENLINPELHFLENLKRMRAFMASEQRGRGTHLDSIPYYLRGIIDSNPEVKEQLMDFPVWTMISDGNFNSMHSPEASMNKMLRELEDLLGFRPFIIIIDVAQTTSAVVDRFSGIDGVMYIPPNPAQIEQFLVNYKDFQVYDIYTPLQSLHSSNRYALVRQAVK